MSKEEDKVKTNNRHQTIHQQILRKRKRMRQGRHNYPKAKKSKSLKVMEKNLAKRAADKVDKALDTEYQKGKLGFWKCWFKKIKNKLFAK